MSSRFSCSHTIPINLSEDHLRSRPETLRNAMVGRRRDEHFEGTWGEDMREGDVGRYLGSGKVEQGAAHVQDHCLLLAVEKLY
jgi:hypothetical protein